MAPTPIALVVPRAANATADSDAEAVAVVCCAADAACCCLFASMMRRAAATHCRPASWPRALIARAAPPSSSMKRSTAATPLTGCSSCASCRMTCRSAAGTVFLLDCRRSLAALLDDAVAAWRRADSGEAYAVEGGER